MLRRYVFLLLHLCVLPWLHGQPAEPLLRLNSVFHTESIRDLSVDAAGRYLLTVSDDKTARLWDAESGSPLRTFRPPIGYGNEGCLYACALSPDGSIAAVGGYTGASWNAGDSTKVTIGNWTGYARQLRFSIYLFATATGEMLANLDDPEAEIHSLDFSPDGKFLAAALADGKGVWLYETKSRKTLRKLGGYGGTVRKALFSKSNRLITIADDNYIRLYGSNHQLMAVQSTGKKPSSIALSPDDTEIALCFAENPEIKILDGETLAVKKSLLPVSFSANASFSAVAFSSDGSIYAGGSLRTNGKYGIYFRNGDKRISIPAANGTITAIKILPDQSVVYATSYPETGRIHPDEPDKQIYHVTADMVPETEPQRALFQLNDSGSEVGLYGIDGKVLFFSVTGRELKTAPSLYSVATDRNTAASLRIKEWKNAASPILNNRKLEILDKDELSQCADISRDGSRILLGTDRQVICLDKQGSVLWKRLTNDKCLAIKIAGDGEKAVVALGNGTFAWLDMKEGKRLLTLFVHPDHKRWITWTPDRFYDCAPGAESLVGWNLNAGKDKASAFYPAAQFRSTFYRPEMIDRFFMPDEIHLAQKEQPDSQETSQPVLTQLLPPTVNILSPLSGSTAQHHRVTLRYHIQQEGAENIESVKILVDGRPVQLLPPGNGSEHEVTVEIPESDCEVSVIATNKFGSSVPATTKLKWAGTRNEDILKPKLYILAVGISQYKDKSLSLQFAAKDAADFAKIMAKQKGLLYGDVEVKMLADHVATKSNILKGLEWITKETTSRDVAMIFFAGHGVNDNSGNFYYLPVEADMEFLMSTCVNYLYIKQTVASVAGKVILFMDACHSGDVMGSARRSVIDLNGIINELTSAENGAIVFTSSTGRQYSLENAEWNNGAFTKALVEGIAGKADLFRRNQVSVKTLDVYITQRVKELTKGQQAPTTIIPVSIPDFPIAVVR